MTDFKACSIDGCQGNAHHSRRGRKGYCGAHYERLWRHGDPLAGRTRRGSLLQFVHDVAMKHEGGDCLIWPFFRMDNGYGQLTVDGELCLVHRYVCELAHGEPPSPVHDAAHNCGKGHEGCVTKKHLEWKTKKANQADRLIHDTHTRGERNSNAKITEKQARQIIALKGVKPTIELAREFGIAQTTVAGIQAGRKWAWLTEGASQ